MYVLCPHAWKAAKMQTIWPAVFASSRMWTMLAIKANDAQFFVCRHSMNASACLCMRNANMDLDMVRIDRRQLLVDLWKINASTAYSINSSKCNSKISVFPLDCATQSTMERLNEDTHQNTDISIYNSINIKHSFAGRFMGAVKSSSNWPRQHCHFANSTWHIRTHTHTHQTADTEVGRKLFGLHSSTTSTPHGWAPLSKFEIHVRNDQNSFAWSPLLLATSNNAPVRTVCAAHNRAAQIECISLMGEQLFEAIVHGISIFSSFSRMNGAVNMNIKLSHSFPNDFSAGFP